MLCIDTLLFSNTEMEMTQIQVIFKEVVTILGLNWVQIHNISPQYFSVKTFQYIQGFIFLFFI